LYTTTPGSLHRRGGLFKKELRPKAHDSAHGQDAAVRLTPVLFVPANLWLTATASASDWRSDAFKQRLFQRHGPTALGVDRLQTNWQRTAENDSNFLPSDLARIVHLRSELHKISVHYYGPQLEKKTHDHYKVGLTTTMCAFPSW